MRHHNVMVRCLVAMLSRVGTSPVVENVRWRAAVKRMGEQAGTPWTLYGGSIRWPPRCGPHQSAQLAGAGDRPGAGPEVHGFEPENPRTREPENRISAVV